MRIAIVGGTGLVGRAITRAAIQEGHEVRAIVRHPPSANDVVDPLLKEATYIAGDVTTVTSLKGCFEDIDVVVHAAGIAREKRPMQTFTRVNVEGTRHVILGCQREGTPHLIYLSSLGADRGASDYHRSKRHAELLVREYTGPWTILRPGNAYGPEGGQIALFVQLIRMLPVVPVVGSPDTQFQPIAVGDLADAVIQCAENRSMFGRTLDLAGVDLTSQRDLYHRISALVNRRPPLVRIPQKLALAVSELLEFVGVGPPVWKDQLTMVNEGNVLLNRSHNALRDQLHVVPTSLDAGLQALTTQTPEQIPEGGNGRVARRRFWVDIEDSKLGADELVQLLRAEFSSLVPRALVNVGAESVSEQCLDPGATISLALPLRGHVQIRVEEVTRYSVTCVTLEGHPLSGVIRFLAEEASGRVRFEVQTIDRPHNSLDRATMAVAGTHLKRVIWATLLGNVVERAGGRGERHFEETTLDAPRTKRFEDWMHELVSQRMDDNYKWQQAPIVH